MRVVVTGSSGLIGRHAAIRLHAANRAAEGAGEPPPYELVLPDRACLADPGSLRAALSGADAVLHFAGMSRGLGAEVEATNPRLAEAIARALPARAPRIVHAGSLRSGEDTPYGRGKARAAEILAGAAPTTDLILPHVFGEGGRPDHNTVTATLIDRLASGLEPRIDPEGRVSLLHAGAAAEIAIAAMAGDGPKRIAPRGREMSIAALWARLRTLHESYAAGIVPELADVFERDLFNTLRAGLSPCGAPRRLTLHADARGDLFEAAKGGRGQVFVSTTRPGVTRGDHFHLTKMERFVVLRGQAAIRLRPALGGRVTERVARGSAPEAIDIPTLHAHSIENIGPGELLTLFWTSEIYDPAAPDTYPDPVLA